MSAAKYFRTVQNSRKLLPPVCRYLLPIFNFSMPIIKPLSTFRPCKAADMKQSAVDGSGYRGVNHENLEEGGGVMSYSESRGEILLSISVKNTKEKVFTCEMSKTQFFKSHGVG